MGTSHYDVAVHFVKGNSTKSKTGHSMFTSGDNTILYSWGTHFMIAIRDDERKLYIINGDRYSVSTSRHQSEFRGALSTYRRTGYDEITVPFSIMNRAGVQVSTITPIEVQSDYEVAVCNTHNLSFVGSRWNSAWSQLQAHKTDDCETTYEHQLGGSLFKAKIGYMRSILGRTDRNGYVYFLSGFDETHNSSNDGYFVSQLPKPVKTISEAYASLMPADVKKAIDAGLDVKRQGDAFAIPVAKLPKHSKIERAHLEPVHGYAQFTSDGKICRGSKAYEWSRHISHYGDDCKYEYGQTGNKIEYPMFPEPNSHGANAVAIAPNGKIYARGNMIHRPQWRNAEHKVIKLGKVWHRIVKNTAVASWGAEARVD